MAYPFPPYCAVCQRQIVVPNNSLLYCSEKCRKEDAQLSSSSSLSHSYSSITTQFESLRTTGSSPVKISTFEPSRKEQWGVPPSPTHEHGPFAIPQESQGFVSAGTSPTLRPQLYRHGSSRPLPPLHPRSLGSSPRSMDLVMPVYRDTSGPQQPELLERRKSLEYARRTVQGNTPSTGGLKKLFNFKELQMSPAV